MRRLSLLTCALAALVVPRTAHATLDEVIAKHASEPVTVASQKLRVRVTGNVREFAGNDGKVFAATWSGIANLRTLLGTHFPAYEAAARAQRPGSHHLLSFSTPELTVRVVAYGQKLEGRVALTHGLPKGVTLDALR